MNIFYHMNFGLPKNVKLDWGMLNLKYTKHALKSCEDDINGYINPPQTINTTKAVVIEVEVDEDGALEKVLYRVPYNEDFDLILAIRPFTREVKTVWLNSKWDKHSTLNSAKYQKTA